MNNKEGNTFNIFCLVLLLLINILAIMFTTMMTGCERSESIDLKEAEGNPGRITVISSLLSTCFVENSKGNCLGWAVGQSGTIIHTSDGGINWSFQNSKMYNLLTDVIFIDAEKGWAVGDSGVILYTDDGGKNWISQESGTEKTLRAITFIDNHGWIAGEEGILLQAIDGGKTWKIHKKVMALLTKSDLFEYWPRSLISLHFPDERNGWAVGQSGTIIHTNDGGINWKFQESRVTENLHDVYFINENHGWAVGDWKTIIYTSDGGETWEVKANEEQIPLRSVFFSNSTNGFIAGYGNYLFVTSDGGENWLKTSLDDYPQWQYGLCFLDNGKGWVCGDSGSIFYTDDYGQKFYLQLKAGYKD